MTPRPQITAGDVLFGRPHFRERRAQSGMTAHDEHPMLVLGVFADPNKPGEVTALTIPISSSPVCARNPHAERARPGLIQGLPPKDDRDSWFCTDSPNMVRINGADNGLRHNLRAQPGAHRFCHGRVKDMATVNRLKAKTKDAITEHAYKVPFQGETQDQARQHLARRPERRVAIVQAAARMESLAQNAAIPSLEAIAAQKMRAARPTLGLRSAGHAR